VGPARRPRQPPPRRPDRAALGACVVRDDGDPTTSPDVGPTSSSCRRWHPRRAPASFARRRLRTAHRLGCRTDPSFWPTGGDDVIATVWLRPRPVPRRLALPGRGGTTSCRTGCHDAGRRRTAEGALTPVMPLCRCAMTVLRAPAA
jgi:hypothetical protein